MKVNIFNILAACVVVGTPATTTVASLKVYFDPDSTYSDSTQSITQSITQLPSVEDVSEQYKKLKFRNVEGDPDAVYFDEVLACNRNAVAVLGSLTSSSPDFEKIRGILRDLNPDLEDGAYYFSAQNNSDKLTDFAQAYVDTHLLPAFSTEKFKINEQSYPLMVYIAASGAYNSQDFEKAIGYFKVYFSTGEPTRREQVYMYMGQACLNLKMYDLAVATMLDAVKAYPENYHLLSFGIKACIDGGHGEHLQELLDKALALKPDDEQLLNIQAQLLEDEQQYLKALEIYNRLDEMKPDNLRTARHIALCYYNLGVSNFNQAIMSDDEKTARKFKRQSNDFFSAAVGKLEEVVANDPTSVKYLKALAVSYGCMDNKAQFENINTRIQALGEAPMNSMSMPPIMSYNEGNAKNYGRTDGISTGRESGSDAPLYSEFAKAEVEKRLADWTRKGEFERPEDYQKRVNDQTIRKQYETALKEAEKEYLDKYARKLRLSDLVLKPYDAANEVYLVESSYGPMYVKVPLANNEAELFKSNWAGIHFRNPKYYIANNEVKIASLTFVTPTGNSYVYNNEADLAYDRTIVDVDFENILRKANEGNMVASNSQSSRQTKLKITQQSDVDKNIPQTDKINSSTVALVIANENYTGVPQVEAALHDGEVFAEYLNKTLGLPKENIMVRNDVTLGNMLRAVAQIKNTVKSMGLDTKLIVYYAGHGMPDEATKDAFLLPVDGDPMTSESCYSLNKLYDELANSGAENVMVFLDACFSGSQRGNGMLTSARSVAIKPKEVAPHGNIFVLSATSGQETAMPYKEKNHGLFTYYLLKKLQQTGGDVTLKDLSDDVKDNVSRQSNLVNQKPQTPQVTLSGAMKEVYQKKKLRDI